MGSAEPLGSDVLARVRAKTSDPSGSVPVPDGPDAGLPWHYGDPLREQRRAERGFDEPTGVWAREALRIAAKQPRAGLDTQEPIPPGQHLRLVHLDGSADDPLPPVGTPITCGNRVVGRLGTTAYHYELGPIGLALIDDDVPGGTQLVAGDTAVSPA